MILSSVIHCTNIPFITQFYTHVYYKGEITLMTKEQLHYMKSKSFWDATGPLDFNMTNDYIFKATLQDSTPAQKGLIGALLRIDPESLEIEVTNPILLGKSIVNKDFYLDLKVYINNSKCLNLEMQVKNLGNWPERSLSYTSRAFDSLPKGSLYEDVMPVHHIGFICFDLFEDHNVLYDTFTLKNQDNTLVFTDKFKLSVVNLTRIDKASNEDIQYHLDKWCQFITAKTWDEIQILAREDPYMEATANSLYELNYDFNARENAIRRKEYFEALAYRDAALAEKDATIEELRKRLARYEDISKD